MASSRTSQTINGYLIFFYLIVYSCLELGYNIENYIKIRDIKVFVWKDFQLLKRKYNLEYIEAFIHGTIIIISLNFNLAGTKIDNSKTLPIEALDMAVFITLIVVGCLRNVLNDRFSRMRFIVTTCITLISMTLCVVICAAVNQKFRNVAIQICYLFKTYDSITSILNCIIFCLAISLFTEEVVKKKIINNSL
jgi:membrane-associated HD superfamily phosphohydrolase